MKKLFQYHYMLQSAGRLQHIHHSEEHKRWDTGITEDMHLTTCCSLQADYNIYII